LFSRERLDVTLAMEAAWWWENVGWSGFGEEGAEGCHILRLTGPEYENGWWVKILAEDPDRIE